MCLNSWLSRARGYIGVKCRIGFSPRCFIVMSFTIWAGRARETVLQVIKPCLSTFCRSYKAASKKNSKFQQRFTDLFWKKQFILENSPQPPPQRCNSLSVWEEMFTRFHLICPQRWISNKHSYKYIHTRLLFQRSVCLFVNIFAIKTIFFFTILLHAVNLTTSNFYRNSVGEFVHKI